jgi:hypothetical protein
VSALPAEKPDAGENGPARVGFGKPGAPGSPVAFGPGAPLVAFDGGAGSGAR